MDSKERNKRIKKMETFLKKYKANRDKGSLIFFPTPLLVEYMADLYKESKTIAEVFAQVSEVNKGIEEANKSIKTVKGLAEKITNKRGKKCLKSKKDSGNRQ